jgi:predicted amidophosphoribosyltransferase
MPAAALAYEFPADTPARAVPRELHSPRKELSPLVSEIEIDCVIPVPLSAARLRQRGYNHAAEIARHVARRASSTTLDLSLCERSRDTPPQMDLPFAERRRNVRGAPLHSRLAGRACRRGRRHDHRRDADEVAAP